MGRLDNKECYYTIGEVMILWLMVSRDKYELPEIVCDSASELSRLSGFSLSYIYNALYKVQIGKWSTCRFKKVEILEDEL